MSYRDPVGFGRRTPVVPKVCQLGSRTRSNSRCAKLAVCDSFCGLYLSDLYSELAVLLEVSAVEAGWTVSHGKAAQARLVAGSIGPTPRNLRSDGQLLSMSLHVEGLGPETERAGLVHRP